MNNKEYIVEDDTWPPKTSPTRFNRMRYGALHFQSNECDLDINTCSEPSSKSYKKYIYTGSFCMRFIRDRPHVL